MCGLFISIKFDSFNQRPLLNFINTLNTQNLIHRKTLRYNIYKMVKNFLKGEIVACIKLSQLLHECLNYSQ